MFINRPDFLVDKKTLRIKVLKNNSSILYSMGGYERPKLCRYWAVIIKTIQEAHQKFRCTVCLTQHSPNNEPNCMCEELSRSTCTLRYYILWFSVIFCMTPREIRLTVIRHHVVHAHKLLRISVLTVWHYTTMFEYGIVQSKR